MPKPLKFEPPHVGSYNEWVFQPRSEKPWQLFLVLAVGQAQN